MTLNEYQIEAEKTAIYSTDLNIIYPTIGLAGEVGEISEKVKKVLRDKDGKFSGNDTLEVAKEIGDAMWYLAILARDFGLSLNYIAELNIQKLKSRQERNMLGGSGDNR